MTEDTVVEIKRHFAYTIVPNEISRRPGLSMRATGLITVLLSHSESWEIRIGSLLKRFPEGIKTIRRAFQELESCGYAKLVSVKDEKTGAWLGKRWVINDGSNRAHTTQNASSGKGGETVVPTVKKTKSAIPPGGASRNNRPLSSRKAVPNGGFDLRLDGLPNTTAGRMCADYNDFLTKHRLHPAITRNGHTHTIKPKYKNWISAIEFLLDQQKTDVVREVMEWYFDNYAEDVYLPRCCALTTFVKSFEKIERAMYRQQHRTTPPPKEEYQVEVTRTRRFE